VQLGVFKACRLLNPYWVRTVPIVAIQVGLLELVRIPRIAASIPALTAELPEYHAAALALVAVTDVNLLPGKMWEFWRMHTTLLEAWYAAAVEVALIMTSSACPERIFSLYTSLFTNSQRSCLADRVETSMQKRFNENQREKDV